MRVDARRLSGGEPADERAQRPRRGPIVERRFLLRLHVRVLRFLHPFGKHERRRRTRGRFAGRPRRGRLRIAREEDHVVDDGAGAGPHFDRLNPFVLAESRRHAEVLVLDGAVCRDRIVLRHRHDGVRLANLPAVGVLRSRGQIRGIALRRAGARPPDDRVPVGVAQPAIVREPAVRRIRVPCWHPAARHLLADRLRPRPRVLVRQERHRRDLARPMTRRAVLVKDGRDILRVGRHGARCLGSLLRALNADREHRGAEPSGRAREISGHEFLID